jgi:hypothetical protein
MSPVGVNIAQASWIIAIQLLLVLLIQIYLPKLINLINNKGKVGG